MTPDAIIAKIDNWLTSSGWRLDDDHIDFALDLRSMIGRLDQSDTFPSRRVHVREQPFARAFVLGEFAFHNGERYVDDWRSATELMVFKYLVSRSGHDVRKETLLDALWPDTAPDLSRRSLHKAVYSLRRKLRESQPDVDHIILSDDYYSVSAELHLWVDAVDFEARVAAGREREAAADLGEALYQYERAISLYRGDYLQGSPHEDWIKEERSRLRGVYAAASYRLRELLLHEHAVTQALLLAHELLAAEPTSEDATRLSMRSYAARGQLDMAARQYLGLERRLRRVSAAPSEATQRLRDELLNQG